jgi:ribosomal protein S18 acetylase RimI-like enzyme
MASAPSSELTLPPSRVDERFLRRFESSFVGGIESVLGAMGIARGALEEQMRAVGEIRDVVVRGEEAGSVWLELRGRTLHLHALLLDEAHRGRGLGAQVLALLEDEFRGRADELELGVQEGNRAAERLYERSGFTEVGRSPVPGFRILRRPLARPEHG